MKKSTPDPAFRGRFGPWALVAGASQGIGAEFARQLAAKGLNLLLVARGAGELQALAAELTGQSGVEVRPLALDLADEDSWAILARQAEEIEIGLLVYNAAYSFTGPFFAASLAEHLRENATNQRTPLALVYLLGKRMAERGRGGVLLMSSLSAMQGSAYIANYAATKTYLRVLAEGLWEELHESGIAVLASCPGAVDTPNYQRSLEGKGIRSPVSGMDARVVVAESLAALGKQPVIIPGRGNRLAAFIMQRLIPRRLAIRIMGRVLRRMYSE